MFSVCCAGAATKGGQGAAPPKKISPPQTAQHAKLPLPLRHFQDGGFFYWRSTENSEKIRPSWRDGLFFWRSTNPKVLAPKKEILLLITAF